MTIPTLLPNPFGVRVDHITTSADTVLLHMRTVADSACCPVCGQASQHRHSTYRRTLADVPWNRVSVRIHLQTRKFFCDNPACARRIFTEPLPDLAGRYARKTNRLQGVLYVLGYALGGEAGARIAASLGLLVSPDALLSGLRRVSQTPPSSPTTPIRVVGVDDWAFRRRHRYGTILVDLEAHRVLDLLPDRTAESVAEWLQSHPEVEIVSRDRADAYAEGIRQGAPQAQQVLDRWHLLKNLGDALERLLLRHQADLRTATQHCRQRPRAGPDEKPAPSDPLPPHRLPRVERERQARLAQRQARAEEIQALSHQGLTISAIARHTGLNRRTIRKDLQTPSEAIVPTRRRSSGARLLTPFVAYLQERWAAGCHQGRQLLRELQAMGYTGSYTTLTDHVRPWRHTPPSACQSAPGALWRPGVPSPASVRWWLLEPEQAPDPDAPAWPQHFVAQLCALCPQIQTAQTLATAFQRLVRQRAAANLETWLAEAEASAIPELVRFAQGLRQEHSAVLNALTLSWSNGPTEGHIHRLKLLKRQMYGRAKLDLLRARVLPMRPVA